MGRNMRELQDFLRSPKLRGNIGEQILKDLLEQYFPRPHFETQYKFDENTKVDAVIKTKQGLIPIDSKLPMENFQKMVKAELETERMAYRKDFLRDVKKHIGDISKKYILPSQGTMDFAVMYIPSEAVYYEIIREHTDLMNYSYEQKVYPVSPNSFYFFLQSILKMMEGEVIQEAAKKIIEMLSAIQKDAAKFGETLSVATTHISNAKNAIDRVNNEYAKLTGKIDQVRLLK
jgi:DNA recombination protein RmuC